MSDREISDDGHAPPRGLPATVLIVEDNFLIALDAADMLRQIGVATVWTAGSQAQALEFVASHAPQFVLLDVNLAEGKSFEVAARLRELGIPFAFATGYEDQRSFPDAFADTPVITKPYDHHRLAAGISGAR